MTKNPSSHTFNDLPDREQLLRYIAENPDKATKRDIARAFNVKGQKRIVLKQILRDLQNNNTLSSNRKNFILPDEAPAVFVARTHEITNEGEIILIADNAVSLQEKFLLMPGRGRRALQPEIGDRLLVRRLKPYRKNSLTTEASPVSLIKRLEKQRKQEPRLGIVQLVGQNIHIMPVDRTAKEALLRTNETDISLQDGDLVRVRDVMTAKSNGKYLCELIEILGHKDDEHAMMRIALVQYEIPYEFSADLLLEAEKQAEKNIADRQDWTHIPFITIDPEDARDHDDAVCAKADVSPENPGGFCLYIAIADVSYYVSEQSPLDEEAYLRGNSVYLPGLVVPMLPEALSNEACSLKAGEVKAALAVKVIIDSKGKKRSHSFHRIKMRSVAGLSYQQAQAAMDGAEIDAEMRALKAQVLEPLWAAWQCLKTAHDARGALSLELPERKVALDKEGKISRIFIPLRLEMHKLIEHFMIEANVAASEWLAESGWPVLYRVHDRPSEEKLTGLSELLHGLNIRFNPGEMKRAKQLNRLLSLSDEISSHLVHEMVLRAQAQAEYSPENIGHFGLNLRHYTHFTSPIRRYSDLIVHRLIINLLQKTRTPPVTQEKMAQIATHISACERRAVTAERDTLSRLVAHHMAERVEEEFDANIRGIIRSGIFVQLAENGADGFIPASSLGADYYIYDETGMQMIAQKSHLSFRLGDAVSVRLVAADPNTGFLRFEMLSKGVKRKLSAKHKLRRSTRKIGRKTSRRNYTGIGRKK